MLAPDRFIPLRYEGLHVARVLGTPYCLITKELRFDLPTVTAVIPFREADGQGGDGKNDRI